ncbi:protein SRG1 [Sesamum alatum]|uniref:Protein SRG1 n=1 Tax=Sesamum alatum TaxID=300844 RepID=A0AAE1Y0Q3_9LAMI|nr:protein SRG1 [Sesamum alatum]
MESKSANLGSSLPVPIVQELAKEKLTTVPPRYVRPDQYQQRILPTLKSSYSQIPVIDMQKFSDIYTVESELHALHNACQEWGFFQLINHGVDSTVVEKMKIEIQEFFNLPIDEKKKFRQEEGDLQGYGQAFIVSEEQKLDWGDMFAIVISPTYLRKPHLIPKLPTTFRRDAFHEDELLSSVSQPELVTGLSPHSDADGLTILLQVNEMKGLQIKKDGVWIPVSPLPNAFTINIGDILEIVTNGAYKSIEHRAIVNREKERLSIATFLKPNLDGDIGPSPSLVTAETPAKFKRIEVTEYLKGLFSRELAGKSYLDLMRI